MKAVVIVLSLFLANPVIARPTPMEKCAAGKYLATSQYALCRAHAVERLFLRGDQDKYAQALSRCTDKLWARFSRLDDYAAKKGSRCTSGLGDISVKQLTDVYLQDVGWRLVLLPFRFVNNGDGTVTDHHSGLTWEMKVRSESGEPDYSNLHNVDTGFPWSGRCLDNFDKLCQPSAAAATACTLGVQGSALGCEQCDEAAEGPCTWFGPPGQPTIWSWLVELNGSNFAGHNDWRIPTTSDFQTIIDQQTYPAVSAPFQGPKCGPTCTDVNDPACGCNGDAGYYTATTDFLAPAAAWAVDLAFGQFLPLDKHNTFLVRAVRGP